MYLYLNSCLLCNCLDRAVATMPDVYDGFSTEDVLTKDAGECAICLDEMTQGDTIARLPCLCIYHKG